MKFILKQDSCVVGGELLLVEVRRRTAMNCHIYPRSCRVAVDGSLFGACERKFNRRGCFVYSARVNGYLSGTVVSFSDHGLIHELLYWISRRI